MELSKQLVSLELAKRLKELGVKQESLFWWSEHTEPATLWNELDLDDQLFADGRPRYSAFTVAELGEMLPRGAVANTNYYGSKTDDGRWEVGYVLLDGSGIYHLGPPAAMDAKFTVSSR